MNWLQEKALTLVLPMLLGPLVYIIIKNLKKASTWIDSQSPVIKRGLVFGVSSVLVLLSNRGGAPINCDVNATDIAACAEQLTPELLKTLLGGGVALILHKLKKSDPRS